MKSGQRITYVDPKGKQHPATVVEITGAGKSNYKIMTIKHSGTVVVTDVAHYGDQESRSGYWLLEDETEMPPERRADLDKQPVEMTKADATGNLPSDDRRSER